MMGKRVHLGTVVQSRFGTVDDDGNVIPEPPVTLDVHKFSAEAFAEAYAAIAAERDLRMAGSEPGE